MKDANWEDLQLFLKVARAGGLTGAADATGLSAPTIGRRMLALERALGRSLFERGTTGYRLAVDGQALLARAEAMEDAARRIEEWRRDVLLLPIVSIATDALTLRFVTRHLRDLWRPEDGFRLCIKVAEGTADLAHRDTNVAIAGVRPQSGNLAVRRSVPRAYAVYHARAVEAGPAEAGWVSLGTDVMTAPWMRWVAADPDHRIMAWANAPRTLCDIVTEGGGRSLLPCFVGDAEPGLVRDGGPIGELGHETFLVAHADDRRRPDVRTVVDRLAGLFQENAALFAGTAPRPGN